MIYQVVANRRTGSSIVNAYALKAYDNFGFNEYLLDIYDINGIKNSNKRVSVESKFNYLERMKDNDIHFTLKVIPNTYLLENFRDRLFRYLKDYDIITIERQPFDVFLSLSYQLHTKWATPHRTSKLIPEETKFKLKMRTIDNFLHAWNDKKHFIESLNPTVIQYSNISHKYLKEFFNMDSATHDLSLNHMDLNYRDMVTNIEEIENIFYTKLEKLNDCRNI